MIPLSTFYLDDFYRHVFSRLNGQTFDQNWEATVLPRPPQ